MQDEAGREQRQRDRHEADDRRAPLEQEGEQDGDDEQAAERKGGRQVAERRLDERGRTEDRRVEVDAGQPGLELLERLLDTAGHVEGVGPRKLLDDEQQPGSVVDDRVAEQRLVVLDDLGDVAEVDGLALGVDEDDALELVLRDDRRDVFDGEALVRALDESARADGVGLGEHEDPGVE